jgi:hypothetical protein
LVRQISARSLYVNVKSGGQGQEGNWGKGQILRLALPPTEWGGPRCRPALRRLGIWEIHPALRWKYVAHGHLSARASALLFSFCLSPLIHSSYHCCSDNCWTYFLSQLFILNLAWMSSLAGASNSTSPNQHNNQKITSSTDILLCFYTSTHLCLQGT